MQKTDDKKQYDEISKLVEKMLDLNYELINTNLSKHKKLLKTQIDLIDNKIDQLVYGLYNLTEEEIEIIENSLI